MLDPNYPFAFRRDIQRAYAAYPAKTRRQHRALQGAGWEVDSFFEAWDKQNNSHSKRTTKQKTFEIVADFLETEPLASHPRARRAALNILSQTPETIAEGYTNYRHFLAAHSAAKDHQVTVVDIAAPMFTQLRTVPVDRRQRRQQRKQLTSHIVKLHAQAVELAGIQGGILSRVAATPVDFVEILAAHHTYEKQFAKVSVTARRSPSKRLTVFQSATRELRDTYLLAQGREDDTFRVLHAAAAYIDDLSATIFDLTQSERNQLMVAFKKHRELMQEATKLELDLALEQS